MRLTPKVVGDLLEHTLGRRISMDPHGFELQTLAKEPRRARLQRGSSIAGHGNIWGLVQLPEGAPIALNLHTRAKLVRAVLEFMAGPRPSLLGEYTTPRAKRVIHPRTGATRFVWYRRLKKHTTPVALVPFGAAHR